MPFYDRLCRACGTPQIDCFEPIDAPVVLCGECGEPTERAWIGRPSNVIGDECDFIAHNGVKTPTRITSKSDYARLLKQGGWRIKDTEAIGDTSYMPESQRRRFPQRQHAVSQYTLDNAKAMLERIATEKQPWRNAEDAPIGITSDEGLIRYMRDLRNADHHTFGFKDR